MSLDQAHDPHRPYAVFDHPDVVFRLFHPRRESFMTEPPPSARPVMIPVSPEISVGAAFHAQHPLAPNILFFHGNGEIAAEYGELGHFYNQRGINFLVADYRGYGRSGGFPTVRLMLEDAATIFEFTRRWLSENGFGGPLVVMGRSLGSASALELAFRYAGEIDGLIIESGFARLVSLLRTLGVDTDGIGIHDAQDLDHLVKIASYAGPVLIIHAQYDHIIPFSEGRDLHEASGSRNKRLVRIANADHNTLMHLGFTPYMEAIDTLMASLRSTEGDK